MADLAKTGITSLSPPEEFPLAPGSWTEWVASNTTGHRFLSSSTGIAYPRPNYCNQN